MYWITKEGKESETADSAYMSDDDDASSKTRLLVGETRVQSHIEPGEGSVDIPGGGTVALCFSNEYSWLVNKNLVCKLQLIPRGEEDLGVVSAPVLTAPPSGVEKESDAILSSFSLTPTGIELNAIDAAAARLELLPTVQVRLRWVGLVGLVGFDLI